MFIAASARIMFNALIITSKNIYCGVSRFNDVFDFPGCWTSLLCALVDIVIKRPERFYLYSYYRIRVTGALNVSVVFQQIANIYRSSFGFQIL